MNYQTLKREFLLGWREARWTWTFGGWLLATLAGAMLVASVLHSLLGTDLVHSFSFLGGVVAFFSLGVAALSEGPDGRLGRVAWGVLLITAIYDVSRQMKVAGVNQKSVRIRIAGHGFDVTLTSREGASAARPSEPLPLDRTVIETSHLQWG